VVIDRAGTIRAVSGGRRADLTLGDAAALRKLIATLLKEGGLTFGRQQFF